MTTESQSLFIVGVPRSGTTLVRSLMQTFDGVYLPPDEFQLIPEILKPGFDPNTFIGVIEASNFANHMRRRGNWPDGDTLQSVDAQKDVATKFKALVLAIAGNDGVTAHRYWGDKTPENLFHLDAIFEAWPDARVIHVLRDPRATVHSMQKSWGRSLLRSSVIWRDGLRALQAQKSGPHADQIYELRYEDITKDTENRLVALAAWLGVESKPISLADIKTEERWSTSHQDGIYSAQAEFADTMDEASIRHVEEICFNEMVQNGYPVTYANGPQNPSRFALTIAKLTDAVRILRIYAKERGWSAAIAYKLRQWRSAG